MDYEQIDLLPDGVAQLLGLGHDLLDGLADVFPFDLGDRAKGAELVAALGDLYVSQLAGGDPNTIAVAQRKAGPCRKEIGWLPFRAPMAAC